MPPYFLSLSLPLSSPSSFFLSLPLASFFLPSLSPRPSSLSLLHIYLLSSLCCYVDLLWIVDRYRCCVSPKVAQVSQRPKEYPIESVGHCRRLLNRLLCVDTRRPPLSFVFLREFYFLFCRQSFRFTGCAVVVYPCPVLEHHKRLARISIIVFSSVPLGCHSSINPSRIAKYWARFHGSRCQSVDSKTSAAR